MAAMLRLDNDSYALVFRPEVAGTFANPASRAGEIVSGNQPKGQRPDQFPDANHDRACEVSRPERRVTSKRVPISRRRTSGVLKCRAVGPEESLFCGTFFPRPLAWAG